MLSSRVETVLIQRSREREWSYTRCAICILKLRLRYRGLTGYQLHFRLAAKLPESVLDLVRWCFLQNKRNGVLITSVALSHSISAATQGIPSLGLTSVQPKQGVQEASVMQKGNESEIPVGMHHN